MRVSCGVQPLPPDAARAFLRLGPFINYVVKNRDFLTVCLSLLTTLLSENREKSWFLDGLSVSFDDVVYEWSLTRYHEIVLLKSNVLWVGADLIFVVA